MRVDPHTLQGKLLPVLLKLGEVLHHKHWQDPNSCAHPINVQAWLHSHDSGVININIIGLTNESYNKI